MKFSKYELLFWMPVSSWCLNWGYFPNARDPEFFFINILFLEIRYFGAYNEKKVCKKCGKEVKMKISWKNLMIILIIGVGLVIVDKGIFGGTSPWWIYILIGGFCGWFFTPLQKKEV